MFINDAFTKGGSARGDRSRWKATHVGDRAIASVIRDLAFVGGSYAKNFEAEFAAFTGAAHGVGVANGSDALEIAIETLGLPKGAEVIVPDNSFIASSEAVTRCGLRVVFADVDPECYTPTAKAVCAKAHAEDRRDHAGASVWPPM